jgi:hypothetical protein
VSTTSGEGSIGDDRDVSVLARIERFGRVIKIARIGKVGEENSPTVGQGLLAGEVGEVR